MLQAQPNQTSDTLLIQQVQDGSEKAFNLLFQRFWGKAYSEAYKRVKSADDAKDIVQDIFVSIWANRETLEINNFPAYLHTAVRNRVLNFVAAQKPVHPFFTLLDKIPQRSAQADSHVLYKEFLDAYEALLRSLPPKRQLIFTLRCQEDLRTKDIAARLGISRKTVQNQLGKAIETLKVGLVRPFLIGTVALLTFLK